MESGGTGPRVALGHALINKANRLYIHTTLVVSPSLETSYTNLRYNARGNGDKRQRRLPPRISCEGLGGSLQ